VNGEPFTPAEIKVLAEGNLGVDWRQFEMAGSNGELVQHFRSQNSLMEGELRDEGTTLVFFTTGYAERTVGAKAKEGDAGRRLNGF